MNPILACTTCSADWKQFLAREYHWKDGYSAKSLADRWQNADGFPLEIERALAAASDPAVRQLKPMLAVPEYKVARCWPPKRTMRR